MDGEALAGSPITIVTAEERPADWVAAASLFGSVWPEYNNHGNDTARYFGVLTERFAHLQVLLLDTESQRFVGRGRTIPFRWDGTLDDLPLGIDDVGLRAIDDPRPPNAVSALAAEVVPGEQGRGLSHFVLRAMGVVARRAGLGSLVAPVRPSWKERYPLVPIERYAAWTRDDGLPFDPWLRVHARLGASVLRPEPRSLRIEAPVEDWERWTAMAFPEDGEYVFPAGLAPRQVRGGVGSYFEPNVWMRHDL